MYTVNSTMVCLPYYVNEGNPWVHRVYGQREETLDERHRQAGEKGGVGKGRGG